MALATARWRSIGTRFTDSGDFAELVVQAFTSIGPASEGDVARVEFYLSYNGAPPVTATTTVMEECYPDHSVAAANLIPGAVAGTLAPIPGYRIQLPMDPLATPVGTITVTATVFSTAGTATPLDIPLTLFNDADGTDRRPSTKNLFVDQINGSDAAAGTQGAPLRNLQKALSGEMGGSKVTLVGHHVWGAPSGTFSQWHCSGGHWVTIEWAPGATASRTTLAADGFLYTGTTPGSACRMHMVGASFVNWGGVIGNDANVTTEVWMDGCIQYSQHWSPVKNWSLRFFDTSEKVMAFTNKNAAAGARMYATNCMWLGVVGGASEFYSLHDCVVTDFIGIAVETFDRSSVCNVLVQKQRSYRDVAGRVHGPVPSCNVTVPAAGQMRIESTAALFFAAEGDNAPMSLATLAEIVGSTRFQVECSGFAAGGNNGVFDVLSAGTNGFSGFCILANPSAVVGTSGAGATMKTYSSLANPPTDLVHPDVLFLGGGTQTNSLIYGLMARDIDAAQTFFSSSTNLVRCAFVNCRDGNNKPLNANMFGYSQDGSDLRTDCLFFNNTVAGAWQFDPNSPATGMCFVNNVLGSLTGMPTTALRVDSNHFITGSTFGTNATTGTWFDGTFQASPWDYTPQSGRLSTGSPLVRLLSSFWWPSATAISRGCDRGPGIFDFAVTPPSARGINASFSATVPITLQAGFALGLDARFSATVPITLQAGFSLSGPQAPAPTPVAPSAFRPHGNTFGFSTPATKSDTTPLPVVANGFLGSGGAVSVQTEDGDTVTFANLPAGRAIDLRVRRVNATGTAAATVLALY